MAIRIPKYNEQIGVGTPNIPIPNAPNQSGLVLGAMNSEFEANRSIAKEVGDIGSMMGKMAEQKRQEENKVNIANSYNSYLKDLDDKMYSSETEIVNGQQRPKGILNRKLSSAKDSFQEVEDYYNNSVRPKYLSSAKDRDSQLELGMMMDKHFFTTYRDKALKHEATEIRTDQINTIDSSIENQVSNARIATTPQSLNVVLDNIQKESLNSAQLKSLDKDSAELYVNKNLNKAIKGSIKSLVQGDQSGKSALELLNSVSNRINDNDYDEHIESINREMKKIEDSYIYSTKKAVVDARVDVTSKIAAGDFDSVFDIIPVTKDADPKLNKAIVKLKESNAEYKPSSKNNDLYAGIINGIYESKTQEEVSNFLVSAINSAAEGKVNNIDLSILANAASNRMKNLGLDTPAQVPSEQTNEDQAYKAAYDWYKRTRDELGVSDVGILNDFNNLVKNGKTPKEAYETALISAQTRINPNRIKYSIGDTVQTAKGPLKVTHYAWDGEPVGDIIK